MDLQAITDILHGYPAQQRYSLAMLQDMQRHFNYIPREGMEALANYLGCPMSSLYAMATFYKALSLKPKGRHIIQALRWHGLPYPGLCQSVERHRAPAGHPSRGNLG